MELSKRYSTLSLSLPFAELNNDDLFFEMAYPTNKTPELRDNIFMRFVEEYDNINFQITEDNEDISDDDLFNSTNSKCYDLHELNQLMPSPYTLGILHTNLP